MGREFSEKTIKILNFLVYFLIVSSITFAFLYLFGLVPESLKNNSIIKVSNEVVNNKVVLPTRIVIDKINVDAPIYNPESKQLSILNQLIDQGAVRYPDSGTIGSGNMLIFGHSADYYTIVNNSAYKTFNGIKKLAVGDRITVYSNTEKYEYIVSKISLVKADETQIDFNVGAKLTISTCNTLGAKEDRQIVEAYPMAK